VQENTLALRAADGSMPVFVVHPERHGPHPVVLVMMDGLGMREALRDQARRLASVGYYVMLPDLYYRARLAEPIDRSAPDAMDRIMALVRSVTAEKAMAEAALCLDHAARDSAARGGPAGVMGYCMGGRLSVVAAQVLGSRVAAAAAIHPGFGNGWLESLLASDLSQISAEIYVGAADNDPTFTPEQRAQLHSALKSHSVTFEIELHKDALHGFGVPGERHQREHAERAWERIHALFRRRLLSG
jgi:carboxymethylenebutenolidase